MEQLEEIFDTFDEQGNWTGTATRQEVHRLGLWHQTFHCWVLHRSAEGDYLILQRRHSSKDTYPDKLDISCAGHLAAGESPADGVRELEEELGIKADFGQLHKVGVYTSADHNGGVLDSEFSHVFLLVRDSHTLSDYTPALDEVSGLYVVSVKDFQVLCRKQATSVTITGFELDSTGGRTERSLTIQLQDMVKYDLSYYEMLFDTIEEVIR